MPGFLKRSLLLRLGLAMASITVLALVGMVSSVVIAEMLKGQAAAINQAGSLRMQSFATTTQLLSYEGREGLSYSRAVSSAVAEFEQRLQSPRLTNVLPRDAVRPLRNSYDEVVREWEDDIRPTMSLYLQRVGGADAASMADNPEITQLRNTLVLRIQRYVERIDRFVASLEQDAEAKINLLRLIQGSSLFLTLVVVYLTMYLMHTDVLTPLSALLLSAERARRGDFSARVSYAGEDELGRLGRAFNVMAEDLSKLYLGLESRVAEKTEDLERTNRSLQLLYHTITQLNEAPISDSTCTVLLKRIEKVLGLRAGAICLTAGAGGKIFNLASTHRSAGGRPAPCEHALCEDCQTCTGSELRLVGSGGRRFVTPIKDGQEHYGVLQFEVPRDAELAAWQTQLLETIAQHIAMAIGTYRRTAESRRLALLEERGAIARELHDSLAQSLSYLKIQVARLQSQPNSQGREDTNQVVRELREGLNGAYRQLRELLTTFRLKIDGRGLDHALHETVAEFQRRASGERAAAPLSITLDNRLDGWPLTVNEEIHILQIVREALSNVARHARASHALVGLRQDGDAVAVAVEDDGIGFAPSAEPARHHYGMVIMSERAHSLGGTIKVERRPEGGTQVLLRFMPAEQRKNTHNVRQLSSI